ncbi:MAG: RNA methyltransferase, partial [Terriglobia bacterium]
VLVRPRNPLNIGAAARALANLDFKELIVVEPYDPIWQEARSAVGAETVVRSARIVESLPGALAGVNLAIGTTSGQRRNLDREPVSLDALPSWLARREHGGPAALLFGSEKTGLSNQDMSYCQLLVRIPTAARCPSMNLGQAVALCCYELARSGRASVKPEDAQQSGLQPASASTAVQTHISPPAPVESLDHLFERAARVLDQVGYLKPKSRDAMLIKLRRMLATRRLSSHDAKILGGVLAQIEWKLGNS